MAITALRLPQKWSFTKSKLPFFEFFAIAQEKVRKHCS